jgi:hypothetical protein
MHDKEELRRLYAASMFKIYPNSIKEALLSDKSFIDEYGFITKTKLFLGQDLSFIQSELYDAARSVLKDSSVRPVIYDTLKEEWRMEVVDVASGKVAINKGKNRFILPDLWPLLPQIQQRLSALDIAAEKVNLPNKSYKQWREKLSNNSIDDRLVDEIISDIRDTPIGFLDTKQSGINETVSFLNFLPSTVRYYQRLAGSCEDYRNLTDYVEHVIKEHINKLVSWNPIKGLSLSLLLSAHSSIMSVIDLEKAGKESTLKAFEHIASIEDRISQTGAIELGLSKIKEWPELEPFIVTMIEKIRDDEPVKAGSHFKILSSLIVLVDGQLSYTGLFKGKPPFLRRLAAITHASLLERCFAHICLDDKELSERVNQFRGEQFYFQSLCDLRLEPRWLPDFISTDQLKAELGGRIYKAMERNSDKINNLPRLKALLEGDSQQGISQLVKFPYSFYSGPLEGGNEICFSIPPFLEKMIEQNLLTKKIEPKSFNILINSSLLFNVGTKYAELTAKVLRQAKHYVKEGKDGNSLFPLLSGLSVVAAVTRSTELAFELRELTRKALLIPVSRITPEQIVNVVMVSAASHSGLKEWCLFIGEWFTELSFQELSIDEAKRIYSHVKCLCSIEPGLWSFLGRVEAALESFISK